MTLRDAPAYWGSGTHSLLTSHAIQLLCRLETWFPFLLNPGAATNEPGLATCRVLEVGTHVETWAQLCGELAVRMGWIAQPLDSVTLPISCAGTGHSLPAMRRVTPGGWAWHARWTLHCGLESDQDSRSQTFSADTHTRAGIGPRNPAGGSTHPSTLVPTEICALWSQCGPQLPLPVLQSPYHLHHFPSTLSPLLVTSPSASSIAKRPQMLYTLCLPSSPPLVNWFNHAASPSAPLDPFWPGVPSRLK